MILRVDENFRSGSVTMVVAPDGEVKWTERTEKLEKQCFFRKVNAGPIKPTTPPS
jgi:hypothetical protein